MDIDWLTVDLVEEIQLAIERGRPVGTTLSTLRGATLPALVEYATCHVLN